MTGTNIHIGHNAIENLPKCISELHGKTIFLVINEKDAARPAIKILASHLAGFDVFQFVHKSDIPRIEDLNDGIERFRIRRCDAILVMGSWADMEIAKMIGLFSRLPGPVEDYLDAIPADIAGHRTPVIAIPCPIAAGPEFSSSSDLFIDREIHTISHASLMPAAVFIDNQFSEDMPPADLAAAGIHALSMSIEAFFSVNATEASREHSREAIRIITELLPGAVNKPSNGTLDSLAHASYLASSAAGAAGLSLSHAISYPLTGSLKLSHERAVGIALAAALYHIAYRMQCSIADTGSRDQVLHNMKEFCTIFGASSIRQVYKRVRTIMRTCELPLTLKQTGHAVTDADINTMISGINYALIKNNPCLIKDYDFHQIYSRINGHSLFKRFKQSLYPAYAKLVKAGIIARSLPITASMCIDRLKGRKIVILNIGEINLLQYTLPIAEAIAAMTDRVAFYTSTNTVYLNSPEMEPLRTLERKRYLKIYTPYLFMADIFISAQIVDIGPKKAFKINIFHNQPVKHEIYPKDKFINFHAHFVLGRLTLQMIRETIVQNKLDKSDYRIFSIGYPKSDRLIRGEYDRDSILSEMGLDPRRPTILYSPSWDEGMSLRTRGEAIIDQVLSMNVNLIVKLHPVSFTPRSHEFFYSFTGGVEWEKRLSRYTAHNNFRNIVSFGNINPLLAASDVMITDISSVAYEFIVLDKPVIYMECPEFFNKTLVKNFGGWGNIDPDYLKSNPLTNAGRHVGFVVEHTEDLPAFLQRCIDNPKELSGKRQEMSRMLLFNPGHASEAAAETILALIQRNKKKLKYEIAID